MPADDDGAPRVHAAGEAAESPRYSSTISGCLGVICVFALPSLLLLPFDILNLSRPLDRLIPLAGVGVSAIGVWLVARVPASATRGAADPLHPLTGEGRIPLRELPAGRANHVGFGIAVALAAACVVGAVLVGLAPHARDVLPGTICCAAAGAALVLYAILASRGTIPSPALHWVRVPIRGGAYPVGFLLLGGISLVWALLIAFEAGYAWAAAATALVILVGLLAGPTGQRIPSRRRRG